MEEWLKKEISDVTFFSEEPMKKHTSFRVGGNADVFIEIESEELLKGLINALRLHGADYFVLGNGSNLLVSDKGYRGCVLHMGDRMKDIFVEGEKIYAQAGALLSRVANQALEHNLSGLEFASGIPGSVGGAMVMNAGAYDGEMSDVVYSVRGIKANGEIIELSREEMCFGYRYSILKKEPIICTQVCFRLQTGDYGKIKEKMDDFAVRRKQKQPLEYPSAGSTFKRPEGYYAGKLIMDAGLSGYRIGGAMVSPKHCGFIVNEGEATAKDIDTLIQFVINTVHEKAGVSLEPEVVRLGEF